MDRKFSKFCLFWRDQKILTGFYNGSLWEIIVCSQSNWLKIILYNCIFIRESRATLELFQFTQDAPEIPRLPAMHTVKTHHFLLENQGISEQSLGILKKFQCTSALPHIKCNWTVLILISSTGYLFLLQNKFSHRTSL